MNVLRTLLRVVLLACVALGTQARGAEVDRCLAVPRPIAVGNVSVEVGRNSVSDPSGATRWLESAVVRMSDVRVGSGEIHPSAGFVVTRFADTQQAWVSFAPSWDTSLAGIAGFAGDVNIWLAQPDRRFVNFVNDADLSRANGEAYELVAAVLANAPELLRGASFSIAAQAEFDKASVIQVMQTVRSRMGLRPIQTSRRLPDLGMAPAARLRGAQLGDWQAWDDPNFSGWSHICEFPAFGGNLFRVNIQPFVGGEVLLPGRPLAERLSEHLRRLDRVIEWALERNIHVMLAFNNFVPWPQPARRWPDDGRSLWADLSAQDELVQAWQSIARKYVGRPGLLFELMNEPHNDASEDYAQMKATWALLMQRLTATIRSVDPGRWLVVTPRWSERNELFDFVLPTWDKVIVDVHAYAPHGFTNQYPPGSVSYPGFAPEGSEPPKYWDKAALSEHLRPAVEFGRQHGVRMICGELGVSSHAQVVSSRSWVAHMLDVCESNGFDWSYWSYGAGNEFGWSFEQTPWKYTLAARMALNLSVPVP